MKKAAPGSEFEAQITRYRESESRDGSPGDPLVNHAQQSEGGRHGTDSVFLFRLTS